MTIRIPIKSGGRIVDLELYRPDSSTITLHLVYQECHITGTNLFSIFGNPPGVHLAHQISNAPDMDLGSQRELKFAGVDCYDSDYSTEFH